MNNLSSIETLFAVCINNDAYVSSLELRKIYQILPDSDAAQHKLVRVIDESGEDYLDPETYFLIVDLPQVVKDALLKAA